MSTTQQTTSAATDSERRVTIVDADVHNFPMMDQIKAHLPQRWREYLEAFGLRTGGGEQGVIRARWMGSRNDSWPPSGKPPGADPDFMHEQLLDAFDVDFAILNNSMGHAQAIVGGGAPLDFTAALMSAGNAWVADEWLGDDRVYTTLLVPYENGPAAVQEIERWADHPRVLQVGVPVRTQHPIGHPKDWDLIEACVHRDLPLVFHVGYGNNGPLTGAGWPSFYYEDHVNFPQALMSQLASLVCEGVFDRWPTLKIVFQETGWSWVPPFLWRFDRAYGQLRQEIPALQRKPSEYVMDHVWYTTQPWEEGEREEQFWQALEMFGRPEKLLFASDYPHWDFDSPAETMRVIRDEGLRRQIMGENALALYTRLPRTGAPA
jgi:predicted TIM-barrel fold metal-dependent hydrolase